MLCDSSIHICIFPGQAAEPEWVNFGSSSAEQEATAALPRTGMPIFTNSQSSSDLLCKSYRQSVKAPLQCLPLKSHLEAVHYSGNYMALGTRISAPVTVAFSRHRRLGQQDLGKVISALLIYNGGSFLDLVSWRAAVPPTPLHVQQSLVRPPPHLRRRDAAAVPNRRCVHFVEAMSIQARGQHRLHQIRIADAIASCGGRLVRQSDAGQVCVALLAVMGLEMSDLLDEVGRSCLHCHDKWGDVPHGCAVAMGHRVGTYHLLAVGQLVCTKENNKPRTTWAWGKKDAVSTLFCTSIHPTQSNTPCLKLDHTHGNLCTSNMPIYLWGTAGCPWLELGQVKALAYRSGASRGMH